MKADYSDFFRQATGLKAPAGPYDYQFRLAIGDSDSPSVCESKLIDIPTGMGKTAAVVLAWLWNRVQRRNPNSNWPRRLVFCLPMRTLVEQTERNVRDWLTNLGLSEVRVEILMGGEDSSDWDLHPEREAILIGTQDMLLSRALNRGYGMSRYRWPMHFGLLNNDCLWVLDETQLMGVGIETSAQLEGFRAKQLLGAARPSFTWWMSATLDEAQLQTVDSMMPETRLELSDNERTADAVEKRLQAEKRLAKAPISLASTKNDDLNAYAGALAEWLVENHQRETLTLVVVNRVDRAQLIYQQLQAKLDSVELALVHSRFRPCDRVAQQRILTEGEGSRIVVATQAVEAGVDVSARTLVTELAPWSSLVQRFGRCHRYGEIEGGADIFWIDLEAADNKFAAPSTVADLDAARTALESLNSASPIDLEAVEVKTDRPIHPVIRRKDLVDLTDTTPDLAGYDLDISRYVRDSEDADVQVFWREIESDPEKSEPLPVRGELVRVSVPEFNKAFKAAKDRRVWEWSHVDRAWPKLIGPATPGRVLMAAVAEGGYDDDFGWTGNKKHKPTPCPPEPKEPLEDPHSARDFFLDMAEHTGNVRRHLDAILGSVPLPDAHRGALQTAANWHDVGKAHRVFQDALQTEDDSKIWAKGKMKYPEVRSYFYCRPHFRHELASALAWLQAGGEESGVAKNLVAFLIAAHHGKVRYGLRAMPGEPDECSGNCHVAEESKMGAPAHPPEESGPEPAKSDRIVLPAFFARGIWQGDKLGPLEIPGTGQQLPEIELDLGLMRLGEGSWLERMIALRDDTENLGPFRLAFLETLLRAADMRASAEEANTTNGGDK